MENPDTLNAELEFWMDDEKYTLTKSCMVFIKETAEYPSACWGDESGTIEGGKRYLRREVMI